MKMKKRIRSLVLCAAMVLVLAAGLLPQRAQAAYSNEQLGLWFHGSFILAQGNAIVLEDGGDGYTRIKVGGQYVDFSQLKYSNGTNMFTCKAGDPTAAGLSEVDIYGGWSDGGSGNTSITINGGNVAWVHGGSSSGDMSGSATITMNGGRAQRLVAAGNGGSVSSSTITVNGGTVSVMIETVGKGVTGDAALVITGGSVADIYRNYAGDLKLGGELSVYTPGIGRLAFKKDLADNYVILEGKNWSAKGNTAKAMNGNYLEVDNGQTLTVDAGQTFTGGIDNYGKIYNYGTVSDVLDNSGTVYNYGTVNAEVTQFGGTIYNYGTLSTQVEGDGSITKEVRVDVSNGFFDDQAWRLVDPNDTKDYSVTLTADAGYCLPDTVTVQVGDKTLPASDYSYNAATGVLTVSTAKMTDKMTVQAECLIDLGSESALYMLDENTFTFTGKAHEPSLMKDGWPVSPDAYTVTYENNVNAGTGKAIFTAVEGISVGRLELEFTIEAADVADVAWDTNTLIYNGEKQYPTISGKLGDYALQWPDDYISGGAAQEDAGTYVISVLGKGNFTGSQELEFTIKPLAIDENAELVLTEHTYDGTQQTATIEKLVVEGLTLTEGTDYTAVIESGTEAGDYDITITGKGNFIGEYKTSYRIAPKALTVDDLEFADKTITKVYDGDAVIDAKVQVKAGAIGNEEPLEVYGLCVFDSARADVATKVTFTTAETELGNFTVPADLQLEKAATITPKPVKVEGVSAQNREYDGTLTVHLTPAMPAIEGIVGTDPVMASVTAGDADSKNAGDRTAELTFKLEGEHAGNYCISDESQKTVEFEITPKSWSVADIAVDGDEIRVTAEGILPGDDATPEVVKTTWTYGGYQVDGHAALVGKDRDNYAKAAKFSANVFRPEAGKEYTTTTKDWTTRDFTVTAAEGFAVSTLPDGTFGKDLTFGEEGENEVTFYVKHIEYDFVSRAVTETYKIDRTCPTGEVAIGAMRWDSFGNVTFDNYANKAPEVSISAEDGQSGVKKVEYLVSDTAQDLDQLANISGWKEGKSLTLKAKNGTQAAVYVRITDNVGNVTVICSDGIVFDTVAPKVSGVKEGVTYYVDTEVTVSDTNLWTVEFTDGIDFTQGREWNCTVDGDADKEYTITATDAAGNVTKVSFKTGKLADAEKLVEEADIEDMTKGEEQELRDLLEDLKAQDTDNATDEEKATIETLIEKLEELLPASTPNTGDLLLPVAGTVCVLALLGMVAIVIIKKRSAK